MKRKGIIVLIMVLAVSLFASGCGDKKETKEEKDKGNKVTEEEKAAYKEKTVDDLIKEYIKDVNDIKEEEYLALVETYRFVDFRKDSFDLEENNTSKALNKLRDEHADGLPDLSKLYKKEIKSDIPYVKALGIFDIRDLTGLAEENYDLVKKLIKKEKDDCVINALIYCVSNSLSEKDFKEFVFKQAKNKNPLIRLQVSSSLTSTYNVDVEGVFEEAVKLTKDKDEKVKNSTLNYIYQFENKEDEVIAILKEVLEDPKEYEFHSSAMNSACKMWCDFPSYERFSEAAYNLTLSYLKITPRTEEVPAWNAISDLPRLPEGSEYNTWKAKATYYNANDLISALKPIVLDKNVGFQTSGCAASAIAKYGTKADLTALKTAVEGSDLDSSDKDLVISGIEDDINEK